MAINSIGFIGGGRITKIILHGWKHAEQFPSRITVTDINAEVLENLKKDFSSIETVVNDPVTTAGCDVVFIALHPPVIGEILQKIKSAVKPAALVISLAPKLSNAKLSEGLGGLKNIARVIPNAPSYVNAGYNPASYLPAIGKEAKETVIKLFKPLGETPEVAEELLEAYALFSGMGPTYFWFQLYELLDIVKSFGISSEAVKDGLPKILNGALKTMSESGLTAAGVMNLIPVKPLGEEETVIKKYYQDRLKALYNKLKS